MAVVTFPAFHVTGPVHHYVKQGAAVPSNTNPILYLGTAEVQPRIKIDHARKPIMNDIAGTTLPAQKKDDGQIASLAVLLNYFSQSTVQAVRVFGRQGRFSRGSLVYGVSTFQVWQVFENALGNLGLYPNLPIGYFWPQVDWMSLEDGPGNQDQKILCQWEASNLFTPQAQTNIVNNVVGPGEREWVLYSQNPNDFPPEVRVPQ